MKGIFITPLSILGYLGIICGLLLIIPTMAMGSYGIFGLLGIVYGVGSGGILLLIDWLAKKFIVNKKAFWILEIVIAGLYFFFLKRY